MIKIVKGVVVTLSAALLLTACSSKEKVSMTHGTPDMATDATTTEVQKHNAYVAHIKKVKKRKKIVLKEQKIDLKKFCFKDNHSIHYKANERCQ